MAASARALYVTGANPDGQLRHFWVPAVATSTSQRSTATSEPPRVTTQSATRSAPRDVGERLQDPGRRLAVDHGDQLRPGGFQRGLDRVEIDQPPPLTTHG